MLGIFTPFATEFSLFFERPWPLTWLHCVTRAQVQSAELPTRKTPNNAPCLIFYRKHVRWNYCNISFYLNIFLLWTLLVGVDYNGDARNTQLRSCMYCNFLYIVSSVSHHPDLSCNVLHGLMAVYLLTLNFCSPSSSPVKMNASVRSTKSFLRETHCWRKSWIA